MTSPVKQVTELAHYLTAALLARTADEGARVALVILAVQRTRSAAVGGTLVAALLIPHVVAAPLVGSMVDRARRPAAVLGAAIAVFAGGLAASVALVGRAPLWTTYLVLVTAGCCGPAITGGLTSRLAGLAGPGRAGRAFGLDALFYSVAGMAGPAAVGLIAATAGPATAAVVLAVAAGLGALGVATLRLPAAGHTPRIDVLGGARAITRDPALRALTLTTSLGQLGAGGLAVVATVLAVGVHRPASGGLLLTAAAAGSFAGSLLCTWRPLPPRHAERLTAWTMIGTGIPLALAAATTGSLSWTAVLFGLSGLCTGPFAAALFLARDRLAPEAVRTQVFTIGAGMKVAAAALGAALIGFAAALPVATQLLLVATPSILAGALAHALHRRRARRLRLGVRRLQPA